MFKKNKNKDVINKSDNLINGIFIVDLLDKGYLDKYMDCLSDNKIYIECPTIIKKKYLTEYEQFLCILDNFITYTINFFSNIELIYIILPLCIANDKDNIFLTKKYFYEYYCGLVYDTDAGWGYKQGESESKFEELYHKIAPFTHRKRKFDFNNFEYLYSVPNGQRNSGLESSWSGFV